MAISRFEVDVANQLAYFHLGNKEISGTQAISDDINVDFDLDGCPVGLELIGLKTSIPNERLIADFGFTQKDLNEIARLLANL